MECTAIASLLKLRPLKGIGAVYFGTPTLSVEQILGKPSGSTLCVQEDPTDFESKTLEHSRKWVYDELCLEFSFLPHDDNAFDLRLRRLEVSHPSTSVFGCYFIGLEEGALVSELQGTPIQDLELKSDIRTLAPGDPEFDMCEYFSDAHQLSFWVERGIVTNVTAWPTWKPNRWITEKSTIYLGTTL